MLDFAPIASELMRPLATPRGTAMVVVSAIGLVLVGAAAFVRTMIPLRVLTVLSNVALLVAGFLAPNPAAIAMYLILIPLNTYRLVEIMRLTDRVGAASAEGDLSGLWLKPYMKAHKMSAGTTLFEKGDPAKSLYLLVDGELEWVEIGKRQPRGQLFGEIAFFSPARARTLTGRCVTDCLVLSIAEPAFKQLYFQNPKFAFRISSLIAQRLGADITRLQAASVATPQPGLGDGSA